MAETNDLTPWDTPTLTIHSERVAYECDEISHLMNLAQRTVCVRTMRLHPPGVISLSESISRHVTWLHISTCIYYGKSNRLAK